ncbi:aldehyde ferredoxin oxidoreductase C-terminal domain-containing protein [Chloroflexota bacterium]
MSPVYGGPKYETIAALGFLCGINDLRAIAKGNQIAYPLVY